MRTIFLLLSISALALAENPLTQSATAAYNAVKQNLIEAAQAMPEENYGFKLTPAQRTFAEWIEHTAMGNYSFCAGIKGAAPAAAGPHGLTSKASIDKALKESFDYCDAALKEMDDRKALTEVSVGERKMYPVTAMVRLIGSLNEHYGNIVGYLRSKGITPPSTARAQQKKK